MRDSAASSGAKKSARFSVRLPSNLIAESTLGMVVRNLRAVDHDERCSTAKVPRNTRTYISDFAEISNREKIGTADCSDVNLLFSSLYATSTTTFVASLSSVTHLILPSLVALVSR